MRYFYKAWSPPLLWRRLSLSLSLAKGAKGVGYTIDHVDLHVEYARFAPRNTYSVTFRAPHGIRWNTQRIPGSKRFQAVSAPKGVTDDALVRNGLSSWPQASRRASSRQIQGTHRGKVPSQARGPRLGHCDHRRRARDRAEGGFASVTLCTQESQRIWNTEYVLISTLFGIRGIRIPHVGPPLAFSNIELNLKDATNQ